MRTKEKICEEAAHSANMIEEKSYSIEFVTAINAVLFLELLCDIRDQLTKIANSINHVSN